MWCKFLLAAVVATVLALASAQVTVEPVSTDIRIRECDNLVFQLAVSGTYTETYDVDVECIPQSFNSGAGDADFADEVVTRTVTIRMDQPTIEVPLPLNDDTVIEQDEVFLCFFTSDIAGVTNGLATLTVIDNDLNCPLGQTSGCGLVPPPNCTNLNTTQTEGVGCFCPDGMLIKADGTCVLPANCVDCPVGQTPLISKSPGPTCDDSSPAEETTETFRCFCPDGMLIKEDGSCVLLDDCIDCLAGQTPRASKTPAPTCTDRDPPEDQTESIRCFCPDGMLVKDATCVVADDCGSITGAGVGDPHYRTYDGLFYDLFDHCSHIFTKDCINDTFTVISITSNQCSGGGAPTCIEEAIVQIPELNTQVVLSARPLQFSFIGEIPPTADLSVVVTNVITVSVFKLGVVVNFGLYYLTVSVPGSYFGRMCGLMGTWDGNPGNDYQLPNGTVVNEPIPDFEMGWRVDLPNTGCDHMVPQTPEPCEGTALQQAEAFCDVLRQPGGPFSACHGTISPDQAFADCVLDHCVCDTELCRCTVILNYAERCQALGITVGPIPTPCVPACPDGLVYSICSPNLPPTCTDQAGQFNPCRPGCACPNGTVLREGDGQCVEPVICDIPQNVSLSNDTIIGDPLYEVPVTVDEEGEKIHLCYQIRGRANQHFNLISDTCVSVNALYSPMISASDGNIISKIGVLAEDSNGKCQQIEADLEGCTARVNGESITMYNQSGTHVMRHMNSVRIAVPNCENIDLVMWVTCEVRGGQPMIKFVIARGFNLRPTSHGLIGQFWNVKVEAERYNVTAEDKIAPAPNHYAVTVNAPRSTRRFFAWKAPHTWDKKRKSCLYSGSSQGGKLYEVRSLSDSVIQGTYNEYEVNGLFDPDYKYEMFNSQCL